MSGNGSMGWRFLGALLYVDALRKSIDELIDKVAKEAIDYTLNVAPARPIGEETTIRESILVVAVHELGLSFSIAPIRREWEDRVLPIDAVLHAVVDCDGERAKFLLRIHEYFIKRAGPGTLRSLIGSIVNELRLIDEDTDPMELVNNIHEMLLLNGIGSEDNVKVALHKCAGCCGDEAPFISINAIWYVDTECLVPCQDKQ